MWARWIEAGAGASAGTAFELLLSSGCVTASTFASIPYCGRALQVFCASDRGRCAGLDGQADCSEG